MPENRAVNLQIVEKVALALEELNNNVVYVGGAVVSLYATDAGAEQARPTNDIDIAVQIKTYTEMDELRIKLAAKKIYPALFEKVLYRYKYQDILIDFIPFEKTPLGPTNSWFKPGFEKAYSVKVGNAEIKILPVSLYVATKWEAYKSRGDDPRTSHDFEDLIYVIDNNSYIIDNLISANKDVQIFLKEMCKEILSNSSRNEIIECQINPLIAEARREIIIQRLKEMLSII